MKESLITRFDSLLGPPIIEPPAGYFSIAQIAEHRGETERAVEKRMAELLKVQQVERIKGRNSNGRACWFYRVKQSEPQKGRT